MSLRIFERVHRTQEVCMCDRTSVCVSLLTEHCTLSYIMFSLSVLSCSVGGDKPRPLPCLLPGGEQEVMD